MKNRNESYYPRISSFKEFQFEQDRLSLKAKLIETKLKLDFIEVRKDFSDSNPLTSLLKDFGLSGISDFIEGLMKMKNSEE